MNVERCCFAFETRVRCDYDLLDLLRRAASHEIVYMEILGSDAVEGGQAAAEDVVQSTEFASALDGTDVRCFLDDADQRGITTRIAADRAQLPFCEIETTLAGMNAVAQGDKHFGEPATLLRGLLEQMIRKTERRLAADARELCQLRCKIFYNRQGAGCQVLGVSLASGAF